MDYTHLGRTGLSVSRLCLGTMNFGPVTTEDDSHRILDRALEHGINFMDTANVYGWKKGEGITENILGRWFAQGDGRREKTVLATKLYGDMDEWPNEGKLSALNIRRACDASLRRLRTDRIDLYQMHHVDRATPWEEIWEAMEVLRQQGKILYVGSSNHAAWHIAKAQGVAQQRHFLGLVSEQSIYNLLTRTVELEVLPACQDYGLGFIPWSPLHGGLLAGVLAKQQTAKAAKGKSKAGGKAAPPQGKRRLEGRAKESLAANRKAIKAYEELCADLGETPADIGLAWLLHQPAVTAPIVGPRTLEQLDGSLRALEVDLDEATRQRLDEIFPGPGGTAPEAYAW
jgi:aryl-alcohol dehydrogenase-like predicted oxidoreductase